MNTAAPQLATGVAVLYVDPGGPYPGIVAEWYDEKRDAKTYAGPWPVVAHPPCGPWGRLKFLCTKQDPSAGPHGVEMVRRYGGVLEHPEHSTLFRHCALPWPDEFADAWGGRTYAVRQVAWGHPCEKRTWLYVVGVDPAVVRAGIRTEGRPTHRVTNGSRGDTTLPRANDATNRRSPPEFARWLLELARQATLSECATKTGESMTIEHEWKFLSAHGEDAPGKSLDSYSQCIGCSALKHDYAHGGGRARAARSQDLSARVTLLENMMAQTAAKLSRLEAEAVQRWTEYDDERADQRHGEAEEKKR